MDEETGQEMPIWLPPTPPNDNDVDLYIDTSMELSYNTSSVMGPDSLVGYIVYSDDDFDVFGLQKPLNDPKPTRKLQKTTTKFKRENISYPQSLFWRRYTPDVLTTRIRKLSPQTKKEGPDWLSSEDWVLIKGLTSALDLPLLLNATVPAQMPNWTVLADFVTSFSKTKRSAVQCKDRIVGALIPREEQMSRSNPNKGRKEQRSKSLILQDKGKEITKLFDNCFLWIKKADWKSKQQIMTSTSSDGSPRTPMHTDLLFKDYDITYGVIQTPSALAQQRAERIQSELPRTSQVHQILTQGPPYNVQMAARANLIKPFTPAPPPPPPPPPSTVSESIKTDTTASTVTRTSTVRSTVSTDTTPTSTVAATYSILAKTTTPSVTTTNTVPKSYSGVDISKGLFLGQRLTQQQLLLLRQTALQQQQQQIQLQQKQQQTAAATTSIIQPAASTAQLSPVLQRHAAAVTKSVTATKTSSVVTPTGATPAIQIPAKLQIPGIDQLRPAITLSNQRVPGTLVRAGLPSRSMQTDEVLALLRQQQALRLAMQSQTAAVKLSQTAVPTTQTTTLNEAIAVAAMAAAIKPSSSKPILVNPVAPPASSSTDKPTDPPHTTHNS